MRRPLARPWTEDDTALLQRLVASGASAARASVAMKRNKGNLMVKARELGMPFLTPREQRKMQARAEEHQRQKHGTPREHR
jgi:hypothetical protein